MFGGCQRPWTGKGCLGVGCEAPWNDDGGSGGTYLIAQERERPAQASASAPVLSFSHHYRLTSSGGVIKRSSLLKVSLVVALMGVSAASPNLRGRNLGWSVDVPGTDISVDSHGVHSDSVNVDSHGVHSDGISIDSHGVHFGNAHCNDDLVRGLRHTVDDGGAVKGEAAAAALVTS